MKESFCGNYTFRGDTLSTGNALSAEAAPYFPFMSCVARSVNCLEMFLVSPLEREFRREVTLMPSSFFFVDFLVAVFLAVVFFAADFEAVDFFDVVFFAAVFLAAVFLAAPVLEEEDFVELVAAFPVPPVMDFMAL